MTTMFDNLMKGRFVVPALVIALAAIWLTNNVAFVGQIVGRRS